MNDSPRLAAYELEGYELDDGEEINREHPSTFWIPEAAARHSLAPDQIVKLIFRISVTGEDGAEETHVERMWVKVTGRASDFYLGELDNQPYCTSEMAPGMPVVFEARHVINIYED